MIEIHDLTEKVQFLLKKANLSTIILSIQNISTGGNNRTYKLETVDGIFVVKKYFRHKIDQRDRLTTEYSFLSYAKKVAPAYVPITYSKSDEDGMALYEYIDGSSMTSVSEYEIMNACQFFKRLNQLPQKNDAIHLPNASEACFSIRDHLELVSTRIAMLQNIKSEEDKSAIHFIERLSKQWQLMLSNIQALAGNIDIEHVLAYTNRCISPSDFGFHNALKISDGHIKFIDFEYAGWDDPARMVADFFSQLAVPVPEKLFDSFSLETLSMFDQVDNLFVRAKILYPVYQMKWCCIALNVFIPDYLARRLFANPTLDVATLKKLQLAKAESLLTSIKM